MIGTYNIVAENIQVFPEYTKHFNVETLSYYDVIEKYVVKMGVKLLI